MRANEKITRKGFRAVEKGVEHPHLHTAQPNPHKAGSTWSRRHMHAFPLEER